MSVELNNNNTFNLIQLILNYYSDAKFITYENSFLLFKIDSIYNVYFICFYNGSGMDIIQYIVETFQTSLFHIFDIEKALKQDTIIFLKKNKYTIYSSVDIEINELKSNYIKKITNNKLIIPYSEKEILKKIELKHIDNIK